ncbi:MAG: GGDEF domain-containing protein [Myxococcales bacterium]|nr:MAG: GGDEF domain-containing protein [Myxococcales bacterium]
MPRDSGTIPLVATYEDDTAVTDVDKPVAVGLQRDCLIVIYHKDKTQQGKRVELTSVAVRVGRDPDNDLVLLEEGVSRRHARVQPSVGAGGWVVMDVGSRNGTLHNGKPLAGVTRLSNGDTIKLGSVIVKYLSGADLESAMYEEVYQLAITDNLTQLKNRRELDKELAAECGRVRRHGRDLSLMLLDIDFFKRVNDAHGHPAGDAVLMKLGALLLARVREQDIPARIGGEELAVLMPETDLAGAVALAEELRAAIAAEAVEVGDASVRVTVSIGCAQYGPQDADPAAFFGRCDEKLYAAKSGGRNRVCS